MLFNNDWDNVLNEEIHKEYFLKILYELRELYKVKTIYPQQKDIFNAFHLPYKDVKVVILGQDPYHGEGEAHGYAFSTHAKKLPPSLKNIYKELYDDLGIEKDYTNGDLTNWQKQGVMLLNTGWHEFTDVVIQKLNEKDEPVVFILWGNNAREKKKYITNPKHLVIESAHPSPFSANYGFFGSKPFSKTNEFLKKNNMKEIEW